MGALLLAGQTFTIQHDTGVTGFSFDRIKVTEVPEPTSAALFGMASLAFGFVECMVRRRRLVPA